MPARRTVILGKPSISTPREGDDNALARAFDNARERIETIEAEVLVLGKFLDANAAAQSIATLQRQIGLLTQQINVLQAQIEAQPDAIVGARMALLHIPQQIAVRQGDLIRVVLDAGGYQVAVDLAQAAMFVRDAAPKPPDAPPPADSQSILASRIFGG